jgi:hypothetical protein
VETLRAIAGGEIAVPPTGDAVDLTREVDASLRP